MYNKQVYPVLDVANKSYVLGTIMFTLSVFHLVMTDTLPTDVLILTRELYAMGSYIKHLEPLLP